jgi:hypothetical protein
MQAQRTDALRKTFRNFKAKPARCKKAGFIASPNHGEPRLTADLYGCHQTILASVQSHQAPANVKVLKQSWPLLDLW